MLRLTARIHGRRRRCSVLMTLLNRSMLRDVRRMDFRRQDSCGGIRSTIGNIIKKSGYDWWIRRIEHCFRLYDVVRIDHFRGFDEYYAVPYGEKNGSTRKVDAGTGDRAVPDAGRKDRQKKDYCRRSRLFNSECDTALKESGFPGMKVLQFAFDSREDSNYLPHTYTRNCVVYTGTHDNDTTKGWYHTAAGSTRQFAKEYMYKPRLDEDTLAGDFIAMAMGSAADLCIVPMQDYLGLGSDARINTPSTLGGNWEWRMKPGEPDEGTVREMERMTKNIRTAAFYLNKVPNQ